MRSRHHQRLAGYKKLVVQHRRHRRERNALVHHPLKLDIAARDSVSYDHQVRTARYELIGDYKGGEGAIGTANVTFTSTEQILKCTFDFVSAGPDRVWMISSGGMRTTSGGQPLPTDVPTDELVSGEAVRIGDFPLTQ